MKDKAMALRMGCTPEQAAAKTEIYMNKYPAVRRFFAEAVEEARSTGYAFTVMGRRRYLPDINSSDDYVRFRAERQASNLPIQGSAAETCKMAMINIYEDVEFRERYDAHMCLQVHDEVVMEIPDDPECLAVAKERVADWMEHPFRIDLGVPLLVDIGIGNTWHQAK
jgi:DNA polymerase I